MTDRNKTFQAVAALISLQEEGEKIYNLRDAQFSDKNRNIPVTFGVDDIGAEIKKVNTEVKSSPRIPLKSIFYMELAKSLMRKGENELRDIGGVIA